MAHRLLLGTPLGEGAAPARSRRCWRSHSSISLRSSRSSSRRSGPSIRSRRRSSTSGRSTTTERSSSRARTGRSRCARSGSRLPSQWRTRSSRSRSRTSWRRLASSRTRTFLFVAVLLPLWSSYLIRVYIWRLILGKDGVLNWALESIGLPAANIGYTNWAVWLIFTYVWLPFMVLPVYGALERIPESYVEASRDLGAGGYTTFRRVILPLALPGVVAGSIFTFSLTLGDYVTPLLAGGVELPVHRQRRLRLGRDLEQRAVRCCVRRDTARRDGRLSRDRAQARRVRGDVMETPEHTHRAHRLDGARHPLPLGAARLDHGVRLQLVERAELADPRLHDEVVQRRLAFAGGPRRALALGARRARRDRRRARARLRGRRRRRTLPLLRPRGRLVSAGAADRAPRASSPAWRSTRSSSPGTSPCRCGRS